MLHLPLWQCPQHRVAEQACQPFPASSSFPGTQLQGRSDLMPITQLSSHSSSLCQPILSPYPHLCPWLPGPTAFCHFSKVALLYFSLLHMFTFLLISSSFSLLSSLLPSNLFFHIAYHWGARASSSPSYFRSSQTQPFHILSLPLLFFNKSVSSAFFSGLY